MWYPRIAILFLTSALVWSCSCHKDPTSLQANSPTGEVVYITVTGGYRPWHSVFVVDPQAAAVTDTIPLPPFDFAFLAASRDGRALYADLKPLGSGLGHLYRVDLRSKRTRDLGPAHAWSFLLSPDGTYLISSDPRPGGGLRVHRSSDGSVVHEVRDSSVALLTVHPFQPIVYVTDGRFIAGRYDYVAGKFLDPVGVVQRKPSEVTTAAVSPDGRYLYYSGGDAGAFEAWFGVVDLQTNLRVFWEYWLGIGDIGVRPNGNVVYLSDFGWGRLGQTDDRYPPSGKLAKYRATEFTLSVAVDLYEALPRWFRTMYVHISPDGRRGYLTADRRIVVLDLTTDQVLRAIEAAPVGTMIFHMTVAPKEPDLSHSRRSIP